MKVLIIFWRYMMRCPDCNGENFEAWDTDLNVAELYLEAEIQCNKCGNVLEVVFGLKVEEIREVD